MSKWIEFKEIPSKKEKKTKMWIITPKDNGDMGLGIIKWYGAWRKYCFFPASDTVFEEDCLNDIKNFIIQETINYKQKK